MIIILISIMIVIIIIIIIIVVIIIIIIWEANSAPLPFRNVHKLYATIMKLRMHIVRSKIFFFENVG